MLLISLLAYNNKFARVVLMLKVLLETQFSPAAALDATAPISNSRNP